MTHNRLKATWKDFTLTSSFVSTFFSPICQVFDYAQYYLNLHSTIRRDETKSAADFDLAATHASSEAKEASPVEAQWRLEYNFTMHYRFRRRRMPGHLGRGIITSSVLESLERKLANNRCVLKYYKYWTASPPKKYDLLDFRVKEGFSCHVVCLPQSNTK